MAFPALAPTSRSVKYGDYPVKANRMMDGFETRILYGSKRTGVEMQLAYNNIADATVKDFLNDYETRRGTFDTFSLPAGTVKGMSTDLSGEIPGVKDTKWRYAESPAVTSVYPGVSNVSVKLLAVLV